MKLFFPKVKAQDGCDFCREGVGKIFQGALSPEALEAQRIELTYSVCVLQTPEPSACAIGVWTWWKYIAKVIFSQESANMACAFLDPSCKTFKTWDCETCLADLKAIYDIATSEGGIQGVIMGLSGDHFCQDPNLGLNDEQVAVCQSFIADFMPLAMPIVFAPLVEDGQIGCNTLFDICPAP